MVVVGTQDRSWGIPLRRPDGPWGSMAWFFRPPRKPAATGIGRTEKDALDQLHVEQKKRCGTAFEGRDARSSIPFGTGYASTIPRFGVTLAQKRARRTHGGLYDDAVLPST